MAKGPADIGNTVVRLFLQDLGRAYDLERGLPAYADRRDFPTIKAFFENRCCYCGKEVTPVQDHLIGLNKDSGGLHAWGNVVPACTDCNSRKHGREWRDFLLMDVGAGGPTRHKKIQGFIKQYRYAPSMDVSRVANELYQEAIVMAVALKDAKVRWVTPDLAK